MHTDGCGRGEVRGEWVTGDTDFCFCMFFFAPQGEKEHTVHVTYHTAVHPEPASPEAPLSRPALSLSNGSKGLSNRIWSGSVRMAGFRHIARIDRGDHSRSPFYLVTLRLRSGQALAPAQLVKAILVALFFGPLIAPLFQATQLPLLADSGALARDLLSRYICPTPTKSYVLLGFPMAVCARCWGAAIGLWAAWYLIRRPTTDDRRWYRVGGQWSVVSGRSSVVGGLQRVDLALAWPARLLVGALPFLLWVAEISLWTAAPYWVLLLNGAFAGFWAVFLLGLARVVTQSKIRNR